MKAKFQSSVEDQSIRRAFAKRGMAPTNGKVERSHLLFVGGRRGEGDVSLESKLQGYENFCNFSGLHGALTGEIAYE